MISVREVRSAAELAELRGAWQELLESSPVRNVFATHEWMSTWWKHFGAGQRLLVLVLSRGREVVGIFPWWIGRTARAGGVFRKVGFLGTGLSDYLDVVLPAPTPQVFQAVLDYLERTRGGWDFLDLREIPEGSATAQTLAACIAERGRDVEILGDSKCPYLPIESDWSTYAAARMGKHSRKHVRNRRKRLEVAGDVQIRVVEDLRDPAPLHRIAGMTERETDGGGGRRRAIFADPRSRAFFQEISTLFAERGWLHLAMLDVNGRTIGYDYGFVYDRKYALYFTGFDPAFSELSPGRVLIQEVLEGCFARRLQEVDFLRGVEPWKSAFTDRERQNQRLRLFRTSLRGRLARLLSGSASR
jgi:CelD/BcsL family acetyltransferase involved in cellulose biosynthesis